MLLFSGTTQLLRPPPKTPGFNPHLGNTSEQAVNILAAYYSTQTEGTRGQQYTKNSKFPLPLYSTAYIVLSFVSSPPQGIYGPNVSQPVKYQNNNANVYLQFWIHQAPGISANSACFFYSSEVYGHTLCLDKSPYDHK